MRTKVLILGLGISLVGMSSCKYFHKDTDEKIIETPKMEPTLITFTETNHDFGKVTAGEKVSHTFMFKNSGDKPLVVSQVQPSCGCTVPQWSNDPIAPGKEGSIQVVFNSEGKHGMQHKSVTVVSNTKPAAHQLTFTAEVISK